MQPGVENEVFIITSTLSISLSLGENYVPTQTHTDGNICSQAFSGVGLRFAAPLLITRTHVEPHTHTQTHRHTDRHTDIFSGIFGGRTRLQTSYTALFIHYHTYYYHTYDTPQKGFSNSVFAAGNQAVRIIFIPACHNVVVPILEAFGVYVVFR